MHLNARHIEEWTTTEGLNNRFDRVTQILPTKLPILQPLRDIIRFNS